ncbi:MAG: hypothetical protein H0X17_19855 [Deltaproteobacteria bacterium]|nr:hypothetical protein [Deltaproteobacteria bacterium]
MQRTTLAIALLLAAAGSAAGRPPPPRDEEPPERPILEWSSWFRVGYGLEAALADTAAARGTAPTPRDHTATWDVALGADLTLPIASSGNVRVGPWVELRDDGLLAGGELVLTAVPKRLDLFHFAGSGILAIRVGATPEVRTASIAYGYSAPWRLWGPWEGTSRYMIGVRFVATATRAHDDPRDWKATFGLEVEPIGALRYLLGIRSLY